MINIGLFHHRQELAGIGGEGFHIASLSLGVQSIKASDDLPEPDRPVMTTSLSRGISISIFFRLWVLAPRTSILSICLPDSDAKGSIIEFYDAHQHLIW